MEKIPKAERGGERSMRAQIRKVGFYDPQGKGGGEQGKGEAAGGVIKQRGINRAHNQAESRGGQGKTSEARRKAG